MWMRTRSRPLILLLACLLLGGAAGAEDTLKIEGSWMVTSMGSASDRTKAPQVLEPGRYTIVIQGTSLVATTQWSAAMKPEVEHDTITVTETAPGRVVASVTNDTGSTSTWIFAADGKGMTATFPDLRLGLLPLDAQAVAATAQEDSDNAPGGPPLQDRPLSGTISGVPWTAAHAVHDQTRDSGTSTCFQISAMTTVADDDLDLVPYLRVDLPQTTGPYPVTVHPVRNCCLHLPPSTTLSTSQVRLVIISGTARSWVIGFAAHFDKRTTISGTFRLELPPAPKPREHFTLDGTWMVHSITSTKPGEQSTMTPEPGAMTFTIKGTSVLSTMILMPDDDDKPEERTMTATEASAGRIHATVRDTDGTSETWVVTADDQGLTVALDGQLMRLVPWDAQAAAQFKARRQDMLQPARPVADGALSGTFDGVAWKAASCIRSRFQMHKDQVDCVIAPVPQKPDDLQTNAPHILLALPRKPGVYPFSGTCNATFCTPPGHNAVAIRGQLVIRSVTDKAITFGLSARADKDHDITGTYACDLTVPVDSIGSDDAPNDPKATGQGP